jgi:hypothetical protein
VTNPTFDRDSWERRWEQPLREHPDKVSSRPPSEYLVAEIGDLQPPTTSAITPWVTPAPRSQRNLPSRRLAPASISPARCLGGHTPDRDGAGQTPGP